MTSYNVSYQSALLGFLSPENSIFIEPAPVPEDQFKIAIALTPDGTPITLQGQGSASATNYHFKVNFQPGVLVNADAVAIAADQATNWDAHVVTAASGTTVYLLSTTTQTLDARNSLKAMLQNVGARSSTGPRVTQITCSWGPDIVKLDPTGLAAMESPVNIMNIARKSIPPLSVGFDTTNMVLSDGSYQNALSLRIVNQSNFPIALEAQQCKFTLSFAMTTDSDQFWALATVSQTRSFYLPGKLDSSGVDTGWSGGGWSIKASADPVEWYVTPNSGNIAMAAGASLEIPISNIVTRQPIGRALLRVQYQGLQEYDDGEFTVEIHKAPLRYSQTDSALQIRSREFGLSHLNDGSEIRTRVDQGSGGVGTFSNHPFQIYTDSQPRLTLTADGKLGIGTTEPAATLDLHGDARLRGDVSVSGALEFGSITRQMIDLYGSGYAIGVQPNTLYLRSSHDFAFFSGGVHSENPHDPGDGGTTPLVVQADGHMLINGQPPMVVEQFDHAGFAPLICTNRSASDWYACVVEWMYRRGAIQGFELSINGDGTWIVRPSSGQQSDGEWSVTVLFIRKELCTW